MGINALEDLYNHLNDDTDYLRVNLEEETGQPFVIQNLEQADWALRKISIIERRRAEAQAVAQAEISKIQAWLLKQEEKADKERAFFDHLLREYIESKRAEDVKLKTIKLPHGKIALRQQQPEFVRDNDILLGWIKANRPEFLRVKEEPDWASLKKEVAVAGEHAVDANGEIIEGVTVVTREDKLIVEVDL
jgi:phage host-nuclease inhibitor protein Gam